MKQSPSHAFGITAFLLISLMFVCCTKEKNTSPASQQQKSVASEDILEPGENNIDTLAFGTYTIIKFLDSSVDHTSQFNGYTFDFKANDVLIAKQGTQEFDGTWQINNDDTKMRIDISGNFKVKDLDGDWFIAKLTDQRLSIVRKGPDKVVFKKQ